MASKPQNTNRNTRGTQYNNIYRALWNNKEDEVESLPKYVVDCSFLYWNKPQSYGL